MHHIAEQPGEPLSRKGEFFEIIENWTPGEVMPVDALGLAFTLIRREVFEEMADKQVEPALNFWFAYGPGHESDDIPFCRRARRMGFRLAIDTEVELGHIAQVPMNAQHWRNYQAERQATNGHIDLQPNDLLPILETYSGPHAETAQRMGESIREAINGHA